MSFSERIVMKIIVDIMGGDNAPVETLKGAVLASLEYDAEYILVGDRTAILSLAEENKYDLSKMEIVDTGNAVITMEDDPMKVIRGKADSSMSVALKMLAEGKGDAVVSTGNTGALFTGATLLVKKAKGIQRPGIGAILPMQKPVLLMDTGANVTVTEENLEQFGVMGAAYMKKMYGIENPRVGLLNNGAEECKGTSLQQAAYQRLVSNREINFVGNVEGGRVPFDACDVLVADGFTGNIYLKGIEGIGKMILGSIKSMFKTSPLTMLSALMMRKQIKAMKKSYDTSEHGGAPILGVSHPVIKAHGSSDAKAFKNAIRQAIRFAESGVTEDIARAAGEYAAQKKAAKEAAKNE